MDELSYIAAGTITALVGNDVYELEAGSYLIKPRGIAHAFWNASEDAARILELIWPPALADAFRAMAAAEQRPGGPDRADLVAISKKYDTQPNPELVPGLVERYGVRLPNEAYLRVTAR